MTTRRPTSILLRCAILLCGIASIMLFAALAAPLEVSAQDPAKAAAKVVPPKRPIRPAKNEPPAFTPEREAAALTFARRHHPELADLLVQLEGSNRADYETAIRQLFVTSESLAFLHEQSHRNYEFELAQWKLSSRIQLLAARLSMSTDPGLRAELKSLLEEQVALKIRRLESDVEEGKARLAKLEQSLSEARERQARGVDHEVEALLKRFGAAVPGDSKTTSAPVVDTKPSDRGKLETKSSDGKPTDSKQPSDVKTAPDRKQPADSKQPGGSKSSDSKPAATKSASERKLDSKTGSAKSGEAKTDSSSKSESSAKSESGSKSDGSSKSDGGKSASGKSTDAKKESPTSEPKRDSRGVKSTSK